MSFRSRIRDEILRILREDMEFRTGDGDDAPSISPEAIVWRRMPAPGAEDVQDFMLETLPGIVLSCRSVSIPPGDGENNQDDWHFQWLIQICSLELPGTGANQDTYWDWQEQIADRFNMDGLNDAVNDGRGCVYITTATMIDEVDLRTWRRAQRFVAGVLVTTSVRKVRRSRL